MTKTSRTHLFILFAVSLSIFIVYLGGTAASQDARSKKEGYFPLSVGNWWVYTLRGQSQVTGKTIKWRVTQTEVVHGIPVFYLWESPAQDDEPLSLSGVESGIMEAGTERFLLKNSLRTGDRWSVRSRSLRAPGKSDAFEVISVGKACFVGQRSFDDCATIRETDEANNVVSLTTYARGVGPVKYVYFKGLHSQEVDTTLVIKAWEVH